MLDAPYGELPSRWVIDEAKKKYPARPILALTHHHMDPPQQPHFHTRRARPVDGSEPGQGLFREGSRACTRVVPDELARKRSTAKVQEVKDQLSLKERHGIRLYNIANPHADGMLIGHVVKPICRVTDILSPRGQMPARSGVALKKNGITNSTIAGGHGTTAQAAGTWHGSEQPLSSRLRGRQCRTPHLALPACPARAAPRPVFRIAILALVKPSGFLDFLVLVAVKLDIRRHL